MNSLWPTFFQRMLMGALIVGCVSAEQEPDSPSEGGAAAVAPQSTCVAQDLSCTNNGDCCGFSDGKTLCVNVGGGKTCKAVCSHNQDCDTRCCTPLNNDGTGVCSTSSCLAGIGAACSGDGQCASHSCAGFCTTRCSSDSDCRDSTSGSVASYCMETSAGYNECFRGCASTSDCSPVADTACQSVVAANGGSHLVCAGVPAPDSGGSGGTSGGAAGAGGSSGGSAGRAGSGGSGGTGGTSSRVCTPGATQTCSCLNTEAGHQTCNTSGSAWGSCTCPATKPWEPCLSDADCPTDNGCGTTTSPTIKRCFPPVCSSQIKSTPCPTLPSAPSGVTVSCDYLGCGSGNETCADSASICEVHCSTNAKCPYGMTCTDGLCEG